MNQNFVVSRAEAGRPLGEVLQARLHLSWSEARTLLRERRVQVHGVLCSDPTRRVRPGQQVRVIRRKASQGRKLLEFGGGLHPRRAAKLDPWIIRFADAHLVVVEKPAGLTTMRHGEEVAEFGARARRFLPPTLADLLPALLPGKKTRVRPVHRLDKETSGLAVFARTVEAERHLGRQFRAHTIERTYLAVVRGRAKPGRLESWMVRDRGDGRRGSAAQPGKGQHAVTHVRVVEELGAYTLVECRLETGRTHQVRIHLGEAGTPLCGERVYDRPLHGKPLPDDSGSPRIALHAASLGFEHPATGKRMRWTSPLPPDLANLVARLRQEPQDRTVG
jgi:23S rRNA pseudouridine1911/1915/1917 synthase